MHVVDLGRIELPSRTPYRTFIQRYFPTTETKKPARGGFEGEFSGNSPKLAKSVYRIGPNSSSNFFELFFKRALADLHKFIEP